MAILRVPFELPDTSWATICQNEYFKLKILTTMVRTDGQGAKRENLFMIKNDNNGKTSLGVTMDSCFMLSTEKAYVIFGSGIQRLFADNLREAEKWLKNSNETFMEQVDHSWKVKKGHRLTTMMTEYKRIVISAAVMTYTNGVTEQGISLQIRDHQNMLDEIFLNGNKFAEFIQAIEKPFLPEFGMNQMILSLLCERGK